MKTFDEYLAEQAIEQEQLKRDINTLLAVCQGARGVHLVSVEHPDRELMVTPSFEKVGHYRVTYLDDRGPVGHNEFDTMEIALRACGGESHTKLVPGPRHFCWHPYAVCATA